MGSLSVCMKNFAFFRQELFENLNGNDILKKKLKK